MVARGDLGVQMPPERVPRAQKDIIKVANGFAIPVITATQMLESMITQPVATRAETSDVANAVWDGTDAVMLSAETAIGQYPVEAVRTMGRIIREAERDGPIRTSASLQPLPDQSDATLVIADAIARAARELADEAPVEHIVVFTLTGASVRRVAKYRPKPAIIGAAADIEIARRLNLSGARGARLSRSRRTRITSSEWPGRRLSRKGWRRKASLPSSPAHYR